MGGKDSPGSLLHAATSTGPGRAGEGGQEEHVPQAVITDDPPSGAWPSRPLWALPTHSVPASSPRSCDIQIAKHCKPQLPLGTLLSFKHGCKPAPGFCREGTTGRMASACSPSQGSSGKPLSAQTTSPCPRVRLGARTREDTRHREWPRLAQLPSPVC